MHNELIKWCTIVVLLGLGVPLKLVLKVGGSTPVSTDTPGSDYDERKHKHKKKKKKKDRHRDKVKLRHNTLWK